LRDKTLGQAKTLLEPYFKLGKVSRVGGTGLPAGRILRAEPAVGTTPKAGTSINDCIRKPS
jgi:hypothetical protein